MSLLDPLSHALATLVAGLHSGATTLGVDAAAGTTWLLVIAAVVAVVRTALLPLVVHGVRHSHASALARPQLDALARRYRNRRDPDDLRAFMEERRRIAANPASPGSAACRCCCSCPSGWRSTASSRTPPRERLSAR
ncbi:hypothetical protein DDE18_22355 [Nocardioides gansuensis]|uniref:Uncharacterized protein n=1 Tax=Nocardioides gansuensis TaxID=2138300 RepID=A0A2T8F4G1_9ACTN|nr:YidC/Oxa1 family membrane protein insertase [Nocardioides gansuensis]PVG80604.1 hypothetical protein DDE18_22355 [Nocardioides gansuensis]